MQCTTRNIGTFAEFKDLQANSNTIEEKSFDVNIEMVAEKEKLEKELRKEDHQLSRLKLRLEKLELALAKLNAVWTPSEPTPDRQMLTDEEKQVFLKIGLKMDEVIFLGRCGAYDAVIGSIHLQWKHREIVKVVTMQTSYSRIMQTARHLEIESDDILINVEKLKTDMQLFYIVEGIINHHLWAFFQRSFLQEERRCGDQLKSKEEGH